MATALKVSAALTRLRDLLGDSVPDQDGNYRWDNSHLFRALSDARVEIVSEQPSAGYVAEVAAPDFDEIVGADDALGVTRNWLDDLVKLAFSKIMTEEGDDGANLAVANDSLAKAGVSDSRTVGGA